MSKILKTLFVLEGETALRRCDTIEHERKLWLVPRWLDNPLTGSSRPERIILLDALEHQKADGREGFHFALAHPMPKDVFEGRSQRSKEAVFVVVEAPDITLNPDDGEQP